MYVFSVRRSNFAHKHTHSHSYLMRLIPAILVPDAHNGAVVKQSFAAGGVAPCQHSVVERREPSPVLVVRRRTQRQQDLQGAQPQDQPQKWVLTWTHTHRIPHLFMKPWKTQTWSTSILPWCSAALHTEWKQVILGAVSLRTPSCSDWPAASGLSWQNPQTVKHRSWPFFTHRSSASVCNSVCLTRCVTCLSEHVVKVKDQSKITLFVLYGKHVH